MLILYAFSALLLTADDTELPSPPSAGDYTLKLKASGFDRLARIHVPKGYAAGTNPPLVLAFHGAGGSGATMLENNGWAAQSNQAGFIVVAPDGLPAFPRLPANFRTNPRLWNSGVLNPNTPRAQIDDVAFVSQLLNELKSRLLYDEAKVFVTGHSNGASMTFLLGAKLSERIAAIAPVGGPMAVADPKPTKPLPTLFIIGVADPLVPFNGGEVKLPWGPPKTHPPVSEFLAPWAKALGCINEPRPIAENDGLKKVEYSAMAGKASLTAIFITNHGHEWPGGQGSGLPESLIGPSSNSLNATQTIWDFFAKQ